MLRRTTIDDYLTNRGQKQHLNLFSVALSVVCAGILLGVAVKGNSLISNYQYQAFYDELRQLEDKVWSYREQMSHWPGDCDRDGTFAYQPQNKLPSELSIDNFPSREAYQLSDSCVGINKVESVNAPFSDMRRAGMLDVKRSNAEQARHMFGGIFQIGTAFIGTRAEAANVIVAYDVPVDIARSIDSAIDGGVGGVDGRVRRFDQQANGSHWPAIGTEQTVTLAYYFDQSVPK